MSIAVRQDWQGVGVGTALLQTLLQWAELNPLIENVRLGVFATNDKAIHLYHKMGFVEEGRRPQDVKLGDGHYVDTIFMHRFTHSP
jgi:ribosomal protein S18 acetylase RimI-like enzyme